MFGNSKITNNLFIMNYKMLPKGPPFKNWNLKVPWGVGRGWISPGPCKSRSECHFNSEVLAQFWPLWVELFFGSSRLGHCLSPGPLRTRHMGRGQRGAVWRDPRHLSLCCLALAPSATVIRVLLPAPTANHFCVKGLIPKTLLSPILMGTTQFKVVIPAFFTWVLKCWWKFEAESS